MSNRKRVTLTFEIDDHHHDFNDEAFMRHDFLQELSCCVNDPYEDTFTMKVEDADTPQETATESLQRTIKCLNNYIRKLETAMLISDDPQVCNFDFTTAWNECKIELEPDE